MIRRIVVPVHGEPRVLEVRSGPPSPLEPGSIRIRVAAAGVNFADLMMRMGLYPEAPGLPFVPGYEVSGTVTERGETAARDRPDLTEGTRVLAVTRFGGYAEEVVVDASRVFPVPEGLTDVEAAALPVVTLTAWMGVVAMGRVREGDRVVVHGIGGGVGLAALQLARAAGARVAGTCGEAKSEAVRRHGAELTVDPRRTDPVRALKAWAGTGVDLVMEPRGGKGVRESLRLLRPSGKIVLYGMSEVVGGLRRNLFRAANALLPLVTLHPGVLAKRNVGIFGLNVLRLGNDRELFERAMKEILEGVGSGRLRPVVDSVFPLEHAADAHRRLHERQNVGKVVLTTGDER